MNNSQSIINGIGCADILDSLQKGNDMSKLLIY
jgi:hypothetical protein